MGPLRTVVAPGPAPTRVLLSPNVIGPDQVLVPEVLRNAAKESLPPPTMVSTLATLMPPDIWIMELAVVIVTGPVPDAVLLDIAKLPARIVVPPP